MKIYQTELDWNTVAAHKPKDPTSPKDPAYIWPATLKKQITEAQRFGMRVLIQVGNAPGWANGGHAGMGWAPKSPITYAQFVQAAARKYPSVRMWMIWGEPNRKDDFRPEVPAKYTQTRLTAPRSAHPTSTRRSWTRPTARSRS